MISDDVRQKIELALDEIRPFLKSDGGDISLIDYNLETVYVRLEGNCATCTVNHMTLKNGVETTIKKYLPEVKKVLEVE